MTRITTLFALALCVVLGACMAATARTYPVRPFHDATLARVDTGITADSLVALLGQPDSIYAMTFGKRTGSEWPGMAYRYYAARDTSYQFVDRWKKNVFYFYKDPTGRLRLNHWLIEYIAPIPKQDR